MSPSHVLNQGPGNETQAKIPGYQAVSTLAIVGLVAGLGSVLAFAHPALWLVPAAALVLAAWALRRIAARAPALIGRRAAVLGLALSLVFGVAAPTRLVIHRRQVRSEARRFANEWFRHLRNGEPHKAHQLTMSPFRRWPLDDALWAHYRSEPMARRELLLYTEQSAVLCLLALGKGAQARHYATEAVSRAGREELVADIYTISFVKARQQTSFFVRLRMVRTRDRGTGAGEWQVFRADFLREPPAGWPR